MSLAEINYIERALITLDEQTENLNVMSRLLEMEFRQIVEIYEVDYLNILSRVKGRDSLKEKILRQGYYKKYNDPKRLIYHLSDLIGIRIECRFEEDEKLIYRMLKKHFNIQGEDGYYYNELNSNVRLSLGGRQPQKQKNGFKIFRIDGIICDEERPIPFELQIKSLVNAFWGEIEHKIIYKNYNFLLADTLLIEMLGSIKNNLALLDKQLLTIYRNVEERNNDEIFQQKALENMLAKMCNDIFSKQIKQSIGMNVNIKKASQTIMNYTFESDENNNETEQGEILIRAMQRLTDISNQTIEFNTPIIFERSPVFATPFTEKLGTYMLNVMNKEFHWNLFFKMLFAIDYQDDTGDFEKFLGYLEHCYSTSPLILKSKKALYVQFDELASNIIEEFMTIVAEALIETDDVEIVYDYNIEKVTNILGELYKYLLSQISTPEEWETNKDEILVGIKDKIVDYLS